MAYKANGVLTYYYRIDPEISDTVKGFWYTNMDGEGFVPHEVTDITLYDTQDTSKLVRFTVPKHTGKPIFVQILRFAQDDNEAKPCHPERSEGPVHFVANQH